MKCYCVECQGNREENNKTDSECVIFDSTPFTSEQITKILGLESNKMIDLTPAMTPEEIEAAAEKEYRRKFASMGGSSKSPKKVAASRANGKKPKRPRKPKP